METLFLRFIFHLYSFIFTKISKVIEYGYREGFIHQDNETPEICIWDDVFAKKGTSGLIGESTLNFYNIGDAKLLIEKDKKDFVTQIDQIYHDVE